MPPIYQALRVTSDGFTVPTPINVILEVQQHLGEGRVRTVAMEATDGMVRGMKAIDLGGPIRVPVGKETLGRVINVIGEPVDELGPDRREAAHAHSSSRAAVRRAVHARGDVRDRHQGHRPDPAVFEGRQDRPVRRRRRGQDRRHHGTDQQRGQEPRRLLGVCRRGRAHPRGQRPVARDDRVGRHQAGQVAGVEVRAGLRPDDRAARSAPARGADRAHRRRVLPRRGRLRHAALHRQHLPLHAGRFRGFDAAGPHAFGRGLPAEPGHRNGRTAGAHHFDEQGLGDFGAGRLRARRRLDRSRAGDDLCSPGRDHRVEPSAVGAGHLSGRRSAGVDLAHSCRRASSATSTTTWPRA